MCHCDILNFNLRSKRFKGECHCASRTCLIVGPAGKDCNLLLFYLRFEDLPISLCSFIIRERCNEGHKFSKVQVINF